MDGTDSALSAFYEQDLSWGDCEDVAGGTDLECADLTVPVDYAQPDRETTTVVLARLASSSSSPRGSLIMNPGGPGGSGVDLMQYAPAVFSKDLQKNYNLVSFDPRGVFRSDGITCLTDQELDDWRENTTFNPQTDSPDVIRDEYQAVGQACQDNSGPVLAHMNTESVARDMDIMRAALGDTQTTYLGFSYGTQLGSTYAQLFPERVGRFVLDGAVDPSLNNREITLGQARSFDESLREFIRDCTESNNMCFTDGSVEDGLTEVQNILARTQDETVTTDDGRTVAPVSAAEGVLVPLYNTATYGTLNMALRDAQGGDYSALLEISDSNHGRTPDGTYRGNSTAAFSAVNCLDFDSRTVTDEQMSAAQQELQEASPTFGPYLGYTDAACQSWPVEPVDSPAPVTYDGENPILVVGTQHDPATPYPWAQALTEQLGNARLLTYDGWGHGAYTSGNQCVVNAVDNYLVNGDLPAEDEVCG
ncbi:alpha/beta hydrolase [Kocuria sp.]|uniref:alpha/beta hydrolase n=1 Tax=Kocuria sp. TaxID=1871328 RepID=UPI0026DEDB34|nr:alpha/beta hydrolase [Kocuria sp.]MDO5618036.1 alpha/beta hydrolase [Kocuria sp.]